VSTDPFYIIGTERSGSNLLRVILNAHPNIDVPHPPHIMRYFGPLAAGYGDLSQTDNRRRLVNDILRLINTHISPWDMELDAEKVVAESSDLMSIVGAIYDQHCAHTNKQRWGCKSTFMVHYVEDALRRDPGARFIWLVRDPRDVAASSRQSVFSPCHPVRTARLWREQQIQAIELKARYPDAVHRLRYEDLLVDPETHIGLVCDFLGEPFVPELLNHQNTPAAKKGAALSESWKNTAAPILKGNSGKFKTAMCDAEIAMVESITDELMDDLGYERDQAGQTAPIREFEITLRNAAERTRIEWRSLREDKNHWRRWNRTLLMTWLELRRGA